MVRFLACCVLLYHRAWMYVCVCMCVSMCVCVIADVCVNVYVTLVECLDVRVCA